MKLLLAIFGLVVLVRETEAIPKSFLGCLDCSVAFVLCTEVRDTNCDYCSSKENCCDNCCGGNSCVLIPDADPCDDPVCTLEYYPVCAVDKHYNEHTFSNECFFGIAKYCEDSSLKIIHDGPCVDPCDDRICPFLYSPVCAADGYGNEQTFSNECVFNFSKLCDDPSLKITYRGACDDPCRYRTCTDEYYPICGTDGRTYGNECTFKFAQQCDDPSLEVDHKGECVHPCDDRICPFLYSPVCAADGYGNEQTFSNECVFNFSKLCDDPSLKITYRGACDDPCRYRICTAEYYPICGTDGRTYGNECSFKLAQQCDDPSLEVDHKGECEEENPCEDSTGDEPFERQPCEICSCSDGQLFCAAPSCLVPACDDPIPGEGLCCPTCPDNCEGYKHGESFQRQPCETCTCVNGKLLCIIPDCDFVVQPLVGGCKHPIPGEGVCCPSCPEECYRRICTLEFFPICGSDGVTYSNNCSFQLAKLCDNPKLTIVHYGDCDIPPECVDCRLVDVNCDDVIAVSSCKHCQIDEVCCDDCCGGKSCVPKDPCVGIYCDIPVCPKGQVIDYDGPGCCPGCKPDCFAAFCVSPLCAIGSELTVPEGECCPTCSPIGSCPKPVGFGICVELCSGDSDCEGGQLCCSNGCGHVCTDPVFDVQLPSVCLDCRLVRIACTDELRASRCHKCKPHEECCDNCCGGQSCVPNVDCSKVSCILPDCPKGEELFTPKGECCPQCRKEPCDVHACKVAPCDISFYCVAYPEATCVNNYCGGCFADWFIDDEKVDCDTPICELEIDSGPCKAFFSRWGYNTYTEECAEFTYGGCLGNANNFLTKEECDQCDICPNGDIVFCVVAPCKFAKCPAYPDATCVDDYCGGCFDRWFLDEVEVDCDTPICDLPIVPGPCRGSIERWGFNSDSGYCETFIYGGCKGNANNFETKEVCISECGLCPDGSQPSNCLESPCEVSTCPAFPGADCVDNFCGGCNADYSVDGKPVDCDTPVCDLPIEAGTCKRYFPSWGYDSDKGKCIQFIYGGCFGNANRFATEKECKEECDPSVCLLPIDPGPCYAYTHRYGYKNGHCVKFAYGGCEGNGNNFETYDDCVYECGY